MRQLTANNARASTLRGCWRYSSLTAPGGRSPAVRRAVQAAAEAAAQTAVTEPGKLPQTRDHYEFIITDGSRLSTDRIRAFLRSELT